MDLKLISTKFLHYFIWLIIFLIPLAWSRYLNANYVSAKFFLLYFVSGLTLLISMQKRVVPMWPKHFAWALGFVVLMQLLVPMAYLRWTDYYYLFKFLTLVFMTYYFFQLEFKLEEAVQKYWYLISALAALISYFCLDSFYSVRVEKMDLQSGLMLGTFGNVNMMAEFLILSLPFMHYWSVIRCKTPVLLKYLFLLVWLFLILYCRSRSAWIGLGLWAALVVWKRKLNLKHVVVLALAVGLYFLAMELPSQPTAVVAVKQTSFSDRLSLYKSTLALVIDHPLGVGLGQFMNEIVPYLMVSETKPSEYVYYDQPHSEWLKWAVQFGWIAFVLPIVLLYFVFIQLRKINSLLLMGTLLVLFPQVSFQFPFENPATILYLSFCFAVFLKSYGTSGLTRFYFRQKVLFCFLGVLSVAHAFAFVSSIFFESSHMNRSDLIQYPCQVYPTNLNGCFLRAQYLVQQKKLVESRLALEEDLKKFPFHSGHMRILPLYFSERGQKKEACETLLLYNRVFENQKFFNQDSVRGCRPVGMPVEYYNPEQFKEDYLKWLKVLFPEM